MKLLIVLTRYEILTLRESVKPVPRSVAASVRPSPVPGELLDSKHEFDNHRDVWARVLPSAALCDKSNWRIEAEVPTMVTDLAPVLAKFCVVTLHTVAPFAENSVTAVRSRRVRDTCKTVLASPVHGALLTTVESELHTVAREHVPEIRTETVFNGPKPNVETRVTLQLPVDGLFVPMTLLVSAKL